MPHRIIALFCLGMSALLMTACGEPQPATLAEKVTLQLKWLHQAQFAGFYVAQDTGLYSKESLEVSFLEGGKDIKPSDHLLSGQADFAVLSPEELLMARSDGASIKAIAAIYRHSAVVFAARRDSDIVRPADFLGKRVAVGGDGQGISDFELQFQAMMENLRLDPAKVDIVPYETEYSGFFRGEVEVTPTYYTGGLIKIRQKGMDPNLIWPADYGIRFYSDILATTDSLISENPELVDRFLRASLQGWKKAIGNPELAVETTLRFVESGDPRLQRAMVEAMLPLVHTGRDSIGSMKAKRWHTMYTLLLREGLLKEPFDVRQAFTLRFLKGAYPETRP